MESVVVYYDFDDDYFEGPECFHIKCNNFQYKIEPTPEEFCMMSLDELKTKYYQSALKLAAYKAIYDYSDFLGTATKSMY